jgi:F420-non-reducing hydrogenase iron-sulfur subunit
MPNYTEDAILGEVGGLLFGTEGEPTVLGFMDDGISYTAADNAGTARMHYTTSFRDMRLPSTALLSRKVLLESLAMGADGLMVFEIEESREAKLSEKLVEDVREVLKAAGVEPERVAFQPMVLPVFKMLPKFIGDHVDRVTKLGKINAAKRATLHNG